MNLAVFELFRFLLRAKQNEIKVNKVQTQGDRPNHMSSGYSKELNVQNFSYFIEFLRIKRHVAVSTCLTFRR